MRLSSTLSLYMGRHYLQSVALVFLLVMLTILIADTIELLRRASGPDKTATIETVLQMASLHIPFMAQKALPFIVLVGGIVTFAKMTRSRELVVARAAGVSVWQFLLPALVIAALLGGLFMTVVNPACLGHDGPLRTDGRHPFARQVEPHGAFEVRHLAQAGRFGEPIGGSCRAHRSGNDDALRHDYFQLREGGSVRRADRRRRGPAGRRVLESAGCSLQRAGRAGPASRNCSRADRPYP